MVEQVHGSYCRRCLWLAIARAKFLISPVSSFYDSTCLSVFCVFISGPGRNDDLAFLCVYPGSPWWWFASTMASRKHTWQLLCRGGGGEARGVEERSEIGFRRQSLHRTCREVGGFLMMGIGGRETPVESLLPASRYFGPVLTVMMCWVVRWLILLENWRFW
jgi:hypothetical protein